MPHWRRNGFNVVRAELERRLDKDVTSRRPDMTIRAVERARWLAELALALGQASTIARTICENGLNGESARALEVQISQLRSQVDEVRRGHLLREINHP